MGLPGVCHDAGSWTQTLNAGACVLLQVPAVSGRYSGRVAGVGVM
jgi:hypothetical protein